MKMEKKKTRRRLTKLKLNRVDLVPVGACEGANILIAKRKKEEDELTEASDRNEGTEVAKAEIEKQSEKLHKKFPDLSDRQIEKLSEERSKWTSEREVEEAERFHPRPDPAGQFLKTKREAAGVTQEQVAKAAGVTQQAVSQIEAGSRPSWDVFSRSCEALNVTTDELVEEGLLRL